ncbi:unnamed protein product [Meganyctiphanes norvegica]|uniref:HEPN AbiU2-like domain-containing protein n=1 Tax=Meganyctiphanes norvegica TaxID=48144 RepID=A0AAV2QVD8_MEGNR
MNKRKRACAAEEKRSTNFESMMDCADNGSKFEEHLPTIRAHYAYLECGRHLLKEIFLWIVKKEDIPNVQEFILKDMGWSKDAYEYQFYHPTREMFRCNEIGKIDISALVELYHVVKRLYKSHAKAVENIKYKIRKERNKIVHNLFLKVTVHSEEELKEYLDDIHKLVEDTLKAFEGVPTEQQKSRVRDFLGRTLNEARTGTTKRGVTEGNASKEYSMENMSFEDIYLKIIKDTVNIVGQTGSLTIVHTGERNFTINLQDSKIENQYNYSVGTLNVGSFKQDN